MNNSNPLIPQGSLLEQKNKGRVRVKVAVFCVLAFHVLVLGALLMQGCKRDNTATPTDTSSVPPLPDNPVATTNLPDMGSNGMSSLPVPGPGSNTTMAPAPVPPTPVPIAPPAPATSEYVVTKGDSFYSISKKLKVSMKALEAANPNVSPTKLKVGEKIQVPAGADSSAAAPGASAAMASMDATDTYVVKSGDSLTKIAKDHGTSVRLIRAANELKTDKIKVGQKLKIPAKAVTPLPDSTPAPVSIPTVTPLPPAAPAPAAAPIR